MAIDTFNDVVGRVLLRAPQVGRFLAEDWVRNAFRRVAERRRWSWMYTYGQFLVPLVYTTGTVTVTRNSTVVTGVATAWTTDLIGRQFRIGTTTPIYTVQSVDSATQITLDNVWGGDTLAGRTYEIYQAYFTPPDDFESFITLYDPNFNWQLILNYTQNELNAADAQRANTGNAYLVAWLDYTKSQIGIVAQPVQVDGTAANPDPSSSGVYTGPNNTVFTVEVTTGGAAGTAVYQWKKDDGSYTTGVTTDAGGLAQELQDGVNVFFPTGVVYILGDVWVIVATAGANPGSPRYEIWPHQKAQYVYPFLYWKRAIDISDTGATLPRMIRGDILLEMSLAEAARWPGPSADKPNPYYRLELSDRHEAKAEYLIAEAERADEETFMADVVYQDAAVMPFAPIPALGDSDWLQAHDI
jgi:hypothetical protein